MPVSLCRDIFPVHFSAENFEPYLSQVLKIRWEDELGRRNPLADKEYRYCNRLPCVCWFFGWSLQCYVDFHKTMRWTRPYCFYREMWRDTYNSYYLGWFIPKNHPMYYCFVIYVVQNVVSWQLNSKFDILRKCTSHVTIFDIIFFTLLHARFFVWEPPILYQLVRKTSFCFQM